MKRRNFIRTTAAGTAGMLYVNSFLGCTNSELLETSLEDHFKNFQNPPNSSRLFVRWWWNGNRLDANEIVREIDVMKAAGITGIEINPIAFPEHADPCGYEELVLFEEKWLNMFELALKEAKKRKMVCDMIVGSGWPFGGEFLEKEEQTQVMALEVIDMEGGRSHTISVQEVLDRIEPDVFVPYSEKYKELYMLRLAPKAMQTFTEGQDVTDKVKNNKITLELPKGEYVLYCVARLYGYVGVTHGAPGAKGPVLNHYNKGAVTRYLNRTSDYIKGRIGNMGDYLRAVFCDSLELEGANWCEDMLEQFEKRRGYSLESYYPYLLKKIEHFGYPIEGDYGCVFSDEVQEFLNRVNLDYYHTRLELFRERFIDTFNDWCHENNVLSRIQAYGRGYHPVESSMLVDLPEGETWLFKEVGREHSYDLTFGRAPRICNKAVASGALLAGKQLVSCEDLTNTQMVFMATLENLKIGGDQTNISGINHSILHGFNYSPLEAPFPGWVRYGTFFNERNTWWPYFKLWSDYRARVSYLLQNAVPQANVAVFQPYNDLWMKHGAQFIPWVRKVHPEYQYTLWEAIHQNGGGCEYVTENIVNGAIYENGKMKYGQRSYDTLLMPEVETLDIKTIKSLEAFVHSGGRIVFIGNSPFKSPLYKEREKNDTEVKSMIDGLIKSGNGKVVNYPAPSGDLIEWYGKMQQSLNFMPYVKFEQTNKYLIQSSYKLGENSLYFLVNYSLSEDITLHAEFMAKPGQTPWLWNTDTGERYVLPSEGNRLELTLPRATSMMVVFDNNAEGITYSPLRLGSEGREITGAWHLELNHMNGEKTEMEIPSLTDLSQIPETKGFAGTVTYTKTLTLDNDQYACIDLGDVQGVAELSVNGENLGVKWYGDYTFNVRGALKKGGNQISVKVTTITGNYLKTQKDNAVAQKWTAKQDFYSMGMLGKVLIG
ncbi:MAG: hypothetical protein GY790_22170 [Bacteroidetes bacterium]|nr:hypothetical protein [Bacteroidota bacterium]